jgi:hypothetical protein
VKLFSARGYPLGKSCLYPAGETPQTIDHTSTPACSPHLSVSPPPFGNEPSWDLLLHDLLGHLLPLGYHLDCLLSHGDDFHLLCVAHWCAITPFSFNLGNNRCRMRLFWDVGQQGSILVCQIFHVFCHLSNFLVYESYLNCLGGHLKSPHRPGHIGFEDLRVF